MKSWVWRSEDTWRESFLSLHHVDPGGQTQVIWLGDRCPLITPKYILNVLNTQANSFKTL